MANHGPNTNTSRFFICTQKADFLNGKHVVFGYVSKGMEVIREIELVGNNSGVPDKDVIISDCGVYDTGLA
jgi:cyclophilin family peptidyl-prolyl cis-trans isomerase